MIAGLWTRNRVYMIAGLLVAAMIPFQKTVASAFVLAFMLLLWQLRLPEFRDRLLKSNIARAFFAFLAYLVLLWLARLGANTDLWSFPILVGSAFAIPTFYILVFVGLEWNEKQRTLLYRTILLLLGAQTAVVVAYPLLIGHAHLYLAGFNGLFKGFNLFFDLGADLPYADPDWNRGTLVDAHQLGFLLAILTGWAMLRAWSERSFTLFVAGLLLMYLFGITETTHAVPSLMAAVFITWAAVLLARRKRVRYIWQMLMIAIIMLPVLLAFSIYGGSTWFAGTNKALLYRHTVSELYEHPVDAIFGYGPATFGSRVANKRLPHRWYALEYPFPEMVPRHIAPAYGKVLERAQQGITGATAQVQVSGLVAIVAEFGLIGSVALLLFLATVFRQLWHAMRDAARIETGYFAALAMYTITLIAGSMCFRQYLEYPQIMSFVWLLVLLPISRTNTASSIAITAE